jgi:nucleotide-binding universal stress UspA family protein
VNVSTHSLEGDPADALLDVAEKSNAAIVVVDGKGMHSADRERFGNVADKLSHSGSSSVLIVFAADAGGDAGEADEVA